MLEAIQDPPEIETRRTYQQFIWECPVPCILMRIRHGFCHFVLSALAHHPTIILYLFSHQGLSWLLLFDVVGRCRRSLSSSFTPRQMFTNFCLTLDPYFIYSPELIPLSYKTAHLSSCSFVYLWSWRPRTCDGGRSPLPDPPHRSFSNSTHIPFCSTFSNSPTPYHMACHFRVDSLRSGFVCTSSLHTYAATLTTSHSPPFLSFLVSFHQESGCPDGSLRVW